MLKSEAAAYLAGVTQTEGAEASAPTNLHVITGEVGEASADGKTLVKIDGLMFSESDDQFIEVDALGGLEEGDIATIVLTGEQGHAMTPLALGSIGSVDRITVRIAAIEADYIKVEQLEAAEARIGELEADHVSVDDLNAATARIGTLETTRATITDLEAATARIGDLEADHVSTDDLNAATARIGTLEADHVSTDDLNAAKARIGTLETNTADIGTIRANSAKVQNLTAAELEADHATVGSLSTTYATIANLNAANGRITNLESTKANISDLEADYITADEIEATYMHANMSNSDVAWIQNGTIKDGAIVSAMINDVSANKLTAGTINGSVINVTNLNADNITTGTINGQRIGEGSLSLSKLEDDVYTESEVDAKLATMQAEIDGAIETWTGTSVPTLNNSPASNWTTAAVRDTHVGDVYFVVNSQSQQNGYNYRFTKSGSTYSWQLIKDSDVTNALQRLETAEGKITTFDSDISTLKTDTGSLTTRTTNLETRMSDAEDDILDKVDTTTFNEVSDTVDQHSQTISQHTTAISNKADSSTVTAVTNRVSKNEQDISGINTTIGELQDTLETKADGSTVSTISNKLNTVSDTVDGHTQTLTSVQNTLSTKADSSTVSTLTTKVNTISDTVDGHTSQLSSITTTQTTMQSTLDKTVKSSIQLWYSKANTTAPSKPTSQVTSTSTSGNAWRIVVPAYNASYPHYYYCWQYEYVDGTYGWSAVVRDIAMGESQSTARTADSNASAAVTTANTANTNASTALTTANTANTNASDAKTAAATASTTASEAKTTAETAASDASTAKTNAASAVSTANSASTTATNAQSTANANIKSSVQLWFTKANSTAPNKPTSVISTSNANTANAWNLVVPVWNKNYPHYFYCYQQQKGDGNYQWTDVVYDRATSEAQQLANTTSTNLSTLQTNYATFKQQTEQFESTVGTTYATKTELKGATDDITALESRVSTNETSISNNTSAIALKANSSDVYTKTAVDGKITQEVSDRNAAITAKANEITSTVSETYATKTAVNAIQDGNMRWYADYPRDIAVREFGIYGTDVYASTGQYEDFSQDFLMRVDFVYDSDYTGQRYCLASPYGMVNPISRLPYPEVGIELNASTGKLRVYSISDSNTVTDKLLSAVPAVDVWSTALLWWDASESVFIWALISDGTIIGTGSYTPNGTYTGSSGEVRLGADSRTTSTWTTAYQQRDMPALWYGDVPSSADYLCMFDTAEKVDGSLAAASSVMCVAGGNVESRVTSAETNITQNAENIELKVSKDGVISSINQSAETVKIQASRVEIDGTAVFSAISSDVDDAITDKGYQTSSQVESAITSKGYATTTQAQGYATTAKSEAISAAATDATTKANAAQTAATNAANTATDNKLKSYSTTAQANNLYDAKGAAATAENNAKAYTDALEIGGRNLLRNTNWNSETIKKFKTANSSTNTLGNAIGEWHRETQATLGFDASGLMTITVPNITTRYGIYQDVSLSPGHYILSVDTGSFFKSYIDSVQWPAKNIIDGGDSRNSVEIDVAEEAVYRVYIAYNKGAVMYGNYMKLEKGNKATDWSPAPEDIEADAVKRTQRIWYRTNASSAPATPGTASSNWVTKADDGNDAWTKMHIAINSTHKYIYTCEQYEMANGTVGYTSVLLDNTITVIDGGNIITGSVTANQIAANAVTADKLAANSLTIGKFTDADKAKVDNSYVQIGGRNLLRNTGSPTTVSVSSFNYEDWIVTSGGNGVGSIETISDSPVPAVTRAFRITGNTSGNRDFAQKNKTLESDFTGPYRFSAWVRGIGGSVNALIRSWNNTDGNAAFTKTINGIGTVWTYIDFEFVPSGNSAMLGDLLDARFGITGAGSIEYIAPKLERGNKATDWSPAPEDQMAYVDAIQVGGRNLLLRTATLSDTTYWWRNSITSVIENETDERGGSDAVLVTPSTTSWYLASTNDNTRINDIGGQYVASVWMRADTETNVQLCCRYLKNDTDLYSNNATRKLVTVTTEWQQFAVAGKMINNQTSENNCVWVGQLTSVPVYVSHFKFERGNKPTDWTPAPEDQIDAVDQTYIQNLTPYFLTDMTKTSDEYWANLTYERFTRLGDGWAHFEYTNSGSSTVNNYIKPKVLDFLEPGGKYTLLIEFKNVSISKDGGSFYSQQGGDVQVWGDKSYCGFAITNAEIRALSGGAGTFYKTLTLLTADSKDPSGTVRGSLPKTSFMSINQQVQASQTVSYDLRLSLYEDGYTGLYKPYGGDQLYATNSALAGTNESLEGAITDIGELSDQLVDTTTEQNKTITDIQKYLNSLRQDLDAEIQSRQQWLNFNAAEGLIIGAAGSTFKTVTTNISQQFRSGGTVLAETSGSEFVAPVMRSDQILIGNWMWTRRDNGNLSLKWIG